MALCYDCERPIKFLARSVRLEDGRVSHRACREKFEFFRRSLDSLPPPMQLVLIRQPNPRSELLADYEVAIMQEASHGKILIWDFGWGSCRYGDLRVVTELPRHAVQHSMHRLGDITIAPLPNDGRRQWSKNEPIVLLSQWQV
jgi:hypothetical protein